MKLWNVRELLKMEDQLTADNMQLNDIAPPGFLASGKSLINEVEKLREAVLLLCELQKELAAKIDASKHTCDNCRHEY
jgi:hypothetical protein